MARLVTSQPLWRKCDGFAESKQIGFPASLMFFTTEMFPKGKQWLLTRERDWFDQVQGTRQETGLEDTLVG